MYKDVILIQKRELENRLQETYIERKLSVPWDLGDDLIKVISGPRRAGKSFFAIHLLRQTGSYGYVNFDDERLIAIEDYDEIVSAVNTVYGNPRYLLFDEIQNLPRWELFVNRLQRQGFRLLITGSNANLLSSELATHLTGRDAVCVLFPFSFGEYLAVSGEQRTAVEKYIRHLQEAYLVFSLPRFSFKLKDQAGHNKKIYCNDNGLAVSSGFRFSADRGVLYENLAAVALKQEELAGRISLFYWRNPPRKSYPSNMPGSFFIFFIEQSLPFFGFGLRLCGPKAPP